MFGLPFPTYLGWILGPGIMIFTFILSFILLKKYEKSEEEKKNKKE